MKPFHICALLLLFYISSAAHASDELFNNLDSDVDQVIVVKNKGKEVFQAKLSVWQRQEGAWKEVFGPMDAVIGRNGLALPDQKKEGDGQTPSGTFHLGTAFGYGTAIDTKLDYRQATSQDFWVDDGESPQYNQWVVGTPQAKSFEKLKRDDNLYQYGIVIEYNTNPIVPGKGSAIFLHIWRGAGQPTAGCVALSEENLLSLLKWLDRSKNPAIILHKEKLS